MPANFNPRASQAAKETPDLGDNGKDAIRALLNAAADVASVAGTDDVVGPAIEKLCVMLWGDSANDLFDESGENQFEPDGSSGNLVVGENGAEAQEPGVYMSLQKGKRPTMAMAMSLSQSRNPKERAIGEHIKRNPQLTEDRRPLSRSEETYLQKLIAPKR